MQLVSLVSALAGRPVWVAPFFMFSCDKRQYDLGQFTQVRQQFPRIQWEPQLLEGNQRRLALAAASESRGIGVSVAAR
jgi:hypothetical protein